MSIVRLLLAAAALSAVMAAQQVTSFRTEDGGLISAEVYGRGTRGVVLAHGGQFKKESWHDQAEVLGGWPIQARRWLEWGSLAAPHLCHNISVKNSLSPMLSVRKGAKAVEFYKAAFGARELFLIGDENITDKNDKGVVAHSRWANLNSGSRTKRRNF